MRIAILSAGLLLLAAPAFAADPVVGDWFTPNNGSKVHMGACPGQPGLLCGTITWLPASEAKNLDTKNSDAALKTHTILGTSTVVGFKQVGPGKWSGGKLYDPASGKTYSGKISVNPDGTLKVQGCVMMICQAQTWKRA
jgi:uncharacterized protein (DUF2147 family)